LKATDLYHLKKFELTVRKCHQPISSRLSSKLKIFTVKKAEISRYRHIK